MQRRSHPLFLAALLALLTACGPKGSGDDGSNGERDGTSDGTTNESVTLQIGVLDEDDQFDPIEQGDEVEIEVGFQGLIFIDFALLGPEGVPERWSGTAEVHFAQGDHDFSVQKNRVRFHRPHDDGRLATGVRVPFSDLSVVSGAELELVVDLESEGWTAHGSANFRAVEESGTSSDGSTPETGVDAGTARDSESARDAR